MSDLQEKAVASAPFAGIPEERLFVRNPHIQASASRSNTIFVGGSFLATVVAVLQLVFGTVTPAALWVALILYIIGMVGIGMGFHRLFSHRTFVAPTSIRVALAIAGSIAAQGSVAHWVSNHRRHHVFTDQPNDVHSPYFNGQTPLSKWKGFVHAQVTWIYSHRTTNPLVFAKDILRDAPLQRVSQSYSRIVIAGLVAPAIIVGLIDGSWRGAFDGALWGGGVRLFAGIMLPSAVNSFGHMTGWRPHATSDQSRNVGWLALLTLGEGWHNNHHAFPGSARLGFRWWQADPIWWLIRLAESIGLITDVRSAAPIKSQTGEPPASL
ncbi:acyl-CoA desaturase [Variovorax sp. OV700]|uniref:acyl-CoA desaturase n=1 Tax=Variovorax sp. OV700 TaxID=1882826 RepID=UPI000A3E102D|nr:acyl-CoA desaturase [Variovorax sp. OV700]